MLGSWIEKRSKKALDRKIGLWDIDLSLQTLHRMPSESWDAPPGVSHGIFLPINSGFITILGKKH